MCADLNMRSTLFRYGQSTLSLTEICEKGSEKPSNLMPNIGCCRHVSHIVPSCFVPVGAESRIRRSKAPEHLSIRIITNLLQFCIFRTFPASIKKIYLRNRISERPHSNFFFIRLKSFEAKDL
jgi:hypothetical protein